MAQRMNESHGSIFRAGALKRHLQGRGKLVLPAFVSPRSFVFLWMLLALALAAGALAWFANVPLYASGVAVVVDGARARLHNDTAEPTSGGATEGPVLITFLPPAHLARLKAGQPLFLQLDAPRERVRRNLIAVEPELLSPETARERFHLDAGSAAAITRPSAVAVASFEPAPRGLPASAYLGSVYPVDVEIGSQRLPSLLPLIGRFFGDERR
jgi:hypothetical protein